MANPPLATLDDLSRLIGDLSGEDATRAVALLEHASEIVRAFADTDWLNPDGSLGDVPAAIPGVVAAMVDRATSNRDGVTQEVAGPFSRSFGPEVAQRLYLTWGEKLIVRRAAGRSPIGTITVTRGPVETPTVRAPFTDEREGMVWEWR